MLNFIHCGSLLYNHTDAINMGYPYKTVYPITGRENERTIPNELLFNVCLIKLVLILLGKRSTNTKLINCT